MGSKCIRLSVCNSVRLSKGLREGYGVKECLWEQTVIFLSACVEGILQLFINFYLQRKLWIFLRNYRDCKVVDPYNCFPQDWPHGGIQRIGWLANWSRFLTWENWHNRTTVLYTKYQLSIVCSTNTYFLPEPKTDTTAQLEIPAHAQQVYSSLHQSFPLWVSKG